VVSEKDYIFLCRTIGNAVSILKQVPPYGLKRKVRDAMDVNRKGRRRSHEEEATKKKRRRRKSIAADRCEKNDDHRSQKITR